MPEIDADLVRLVVLVVGGLVVILLLILLSAVGKLRKSIEGVREDLQRVPDTSAASEARGSAPEAEPSMTPATAQETAGPGVLAAAPEPSPAPIQEADESPVAAPAQEAPAAAQEAPAQEEAPVPAQVAAVATHEEKAPSPSVYAQPAAEVAEVEEPQEQPFERDGRWWFRRGEELLVYEEQSGQWAPAPAAAPDTADLRSTSFTELTNAAPEPEPSQEVAAAGFWKCPSCGAVNGTTASTCRMCFAARP